MAVDLERRELLRTYQQVVNVLLRTYANDEVISETVSDVTSFRQSSSMTEEVYSNHLWDKAIRCGTEFSDQRLKSLFVEGLLPATCAQVRNYLATDPDVDYQSVARYAQAIGETNRASRRQVMSAMSHREPSRAARRFHRTARTRPVLSVESASDIPTAGGFAEESILAVTDQTATPTSMSSPPKNYYPSPAASTASAPVPPANSGDVRTGPDERQGQEPRVRISGGRFSGPQPCRFCLDTTHRQEAFLVVAGAGLRAKLLEAREANYQKLRIRQGLRPGSPFNRQGPSAWRDQRQAAPAGVNVIEESHPDPTEYHVAKAADETREDLLLTGEAGEDA